MVSPCNLLSYSVFGKESVEGLVAKVAALITNYGSRRPIPGEDVLLEKLEHHLGIIHGSGNSFHPLAYIVHRQQDIQLPKGLRERPHQIYALSIKDLNFHNVV